MKKLFLQSGDACGICGGPCVVGSKGLYCPKCQPNKALNEVGIVATGIPEPIPEKGDKGGECYRALCSTKEAYWYNHSTQRYYCQACAFLINDHNKLDAMRLYGHDLCTIETVPESGETPEKKLTFCDKCGELIVRGTEHECYYVPVPSEKDVERARMILKANGLYLDQIVGKVYLSKLSSRRNAVPPPSQAERDSQEELWKEAINLYSKRDHSADGRADMMKEFTITRKTKP